MRFVIFIIGLPWWVLMALGALTAYGGFALNKSVAERGVELEAALAAEAPAAVPLHLHNETNVGAFDESRVIAQIDFDENVRLVERTNGVKTKETAMYVLFGPDADEDAQIIKAVIMVGSRRVDAFADWASGRLTGAGERGFTYDIHGEFDTYHSQSSHAAEVLEERGFIVPSDIYFITPYINGREGGLRHSARGTGDMQMLAFGLAAGLFLLGLVKFLFTRGTKRSPQKPMREPFAPETASPAAPSLAAQPVETPKPSYAPGPKATRAAKLYEKQQAAAVTEPAPQQRQLSALEKARAFKAAAAAPVHSKQTFRQKMRQDPFAKLANESRA
ncbi:MAG: hypothetical protein AAGA47_11260 [Pseudomonadota bacterium]